MVSRELNVFRRNWGSNITNTIVIFTPQKSDCYLIFGITVATEVIKNSEALQELPEESFEAINRFLDSIAPKDEEK